MDPNVLIALIGEGSTALVAITALTVSHRGFSSIGTRFSSIDARFSSLEATLNARFAARDARLDLMQADMRDLNRTRTAIEIDVARLKDKIER